MKSLLFCLTIIFLPSCSDHSVELVPNSKIVEDSIPLSLTGRIGNEEIGRNVFTDRQQGHCILCHAVQTVPESFQGNVGPDLTFVGDRLSSAQIRLRIVDYQIVKPDALMPSYFRVHNLNQVEEERNGKPALSADQIENLVTFLTNLRSDNNDES